MKTNASAGKRGRLFGNSVTTVLNFVEILIPMVLSFPLLVQWIDDLGGIEDFSWLFSSLLSSLGLGLLVFFLHVKIGVDPFRITTGGFLGFYLLAFFHGDFSYAAFSFALSQLLAFTIVRRVKNKSAFFQSDAVLLVSISFSIFHWRIFRIVDVAMFQILTFLLLAAAYFINTVMITRKYGVTPASKAGDIPLNFAPLASGRTYLRGAMAFLFLAFSATAAAFSPVLFETLFALEFEQFFQTYMLTLLYFSGFTSAIVIAALVAFFIKRFTLKAVVKIILNVSILVTAATCVGLVFLLVETSVVHSQAVLILPLVFSLGIGLLFAHAFMALRKKTKSSLRD
ncbi:hypothetical protein GF325_00610 [Candidatus Bathyarchaeota archaeon]|nr:hypothetical protein [Candidatus Bathyarchaeota archaeon]